jgi:hypothetical protein
MWTQEQAIELCRKVEPIVAQFGCHVALTGGLLYKSGARKDCDLIVYRSGQEFGDEARGSFFDTIDRDGLFEALKAIDITINIEHTRVVKAHYGLKDMRLQHVDFIFPECDGEYVTGEEAKDQVAMDLIVNSTGAG